MSLSLSIHGSPSRVPDFSSLAAAGGAGSASASAASAVFAAATQSSLSHLSAVELPVGFFSGAADTSTPPGTPPGSPARSQDSDSFKKRRMLLAQATPAKRSPKMDQIAARYIAIKDCLEAGTLNYSATPCSLRWIGSGDYSDCYRITAPHEMTGYVVKAFHETRINRSPSDLRAMAEHSIAQYRQLKALGVGVANILNADTAIGDCFTVVEFVPGTINPDTWSRLSLEALDADQRSLLGRVRQIFEIAVTHHLSLDLLPSNLRQKESGEIVITDFCEEPFDGDAFNVEISTRLKKWSSHRSVQRFLMENLTDSFKAIHSEVIKGPDFHD